MKSNPKKDALEVTPFAGEKPEDMIKRFAKKFKNSGLIQELMLRRSFEKRSAKRKRKLIRSMLNRRSEERG